jgi:hypothetical protein
MVPGDLSFGGRFFNVNFQPGWSVFILQNTSPILRNNPGFVGGGRTAGGAREFVIPNSRLEDLENLFIRSVK